MPTTTTSANSALTTAIATDTSLPLITGIVGTPTSSTEGTTAIPTTTEPICKIQTALMNDRFISKPEFSTPIIGLVSDLNPSGKGIEFVVKTSSTSVNIILPLKNNVIITNFTKLQILRRSNVNQFCLTFLDKQRQPINQYKIFSTNSQQSLIPPTINEFPIKTSLFRKIRFLRIDILDTNDNRPPKHVTLLVQACFKRIPSKSIS